MSEYTPTKEVVAECYVTTDPNPEGYGLMGMDPPTEEESRAEFDRFIAKVKADALREAAAKLRDGIGSCNTGCHVSDMMTLQALADRIESGDGQ